MAASASHQLPPQRGAIEWLRSTYEYCEGARVPRSDVYADYELCCQSTCRRALDRSIFGKLLKNVFPGVFLRRLGPRKASKFFYISLRRKLDAPARKSRDSQDLGLPSPMERRTPEGNHFSVSPRSSEFDSPSTSIYSSLPGSPLEPFQLQLHLQFNTPGTHEGLVNHFHEMYKSHCENLGVAVSNYDSAGVHNELMTFWDSVPSSIIDQLTEPEFATSLLAHDNNVIGPIVDLMSFEAALGLRIPTDSLRDFVGTLDKTLVLGMRGAPYEFIVQRCHVIRASLARLMQTVDVRTGA